jgi:hypothetical protein
VASWVLFVRAAAVGALGVPVNVGDARGARSASAVVRAVVSVATAVPTNAVVASWVVLVPAVAVGAAGVPVKVGDARGALLASAAMALEDSTPTAESV